MLEGTEKGNNHVRDLFKHLKKDKLPATWQKKTPNIKNMAPHVRVAHHCVPAGPVSLLAVTCLQAWIEDVARRLAQLQKIIAMDATSYGSASIWLGGLFSPEAFVQASRQVWG